MCVCSNLLDLSPERDTCSFRKFSGATVAAVRRNFIPLTCRESPAVLFCPAFPTPSSAERNPRRPSNPEISRHLTPWRDGRKIPVVQTVVPLLLSLPRERERKSIWDESHCLRTMLTRSVPNRFFSLDLRLLRSIVLLPKQCRNRNYREKRCRI